MSYQISDYVVIGVDVISYSKKELNDQVQSQQIVDRCLETAVTAHWKWSKEDVHWIDAGDGGYLLTNGHANVAVDIVDTFQARIKEETRKWVENDKLHLRYALHIDKVKIWDGKFGRKFTGHAINNCARLLNGMNKQQMGQVVCSGNFLESVRGFGDIQFEVQRLKDVKDKHGIKHLRHNIWRSPGFGLLALEEEIHNDPEHR